MVALVLTGMIALTAYGALQAGASTRARVDGPLRARESALLARELLADALRHAGDVGDTTIVFARADGAGDVLDFVTRGIATTGEMLGAAPRWRVQVGPGARADSGDVVLVAAPLDASGPALRGVLTGVRAVRVAALAVDGWRSAPEIDRVPEVVRVDFVASPGREPLPPVVARTVEGGLR